MPQIGIFPAVSGWLPLLVAAGLGGPALAQVAPEAVPALPPRVLSHESGTRGEERGGRYVILDPRTTFRVPPDTTILVAFQWLGTPGKHRLTGCGKLPTASNSTRVSNISPPHGSSVRTGHCH
jgi:hypothetical protein